MRHLSLAAVFAAVSLVCLSLGERANAAVVVRIDRATQTMAVNVDGYTRYMWRVSTGRPGLGTPAGVFRPHSMARQWYSRKYYNSPMPHAIFFSGGLAIHGSYEIAHLGRPASHGCVRLYPANAAVLFSLVQREGMRNTTIVVQ